jgi:hypothetical protein
LVAVNVGQLADEDAYVGFLEPLCPCDVYHDADQHDLGRCGAKCIARGKADCLSTAVGARGMIGWDDVCRQTTL